MWEVDTEQKSKLLTLQKLPANLTCVDCSAPSPQWSSPKFGTFHCLTCAGLHRALGVHISFIRSITMDAFKPVEISRLEKGGNAAWREFWVSKNPGREWAVPPSQTVLEDRYGGDTGEEYKERLTCLVEGREFEGLAPRPQRKKNEAESPAATRTASPSGSMMGVQGQSQKAANESFFARKGSENASRPEGIAPSQGGKYAGFGSEPIVVGGAGKKDEMPGVDEFQKDPVAALRSGFGWFASSVGKGARSVNEGWVQPTAKKLQEADLATQARITAASVGQTLQTGTRSAAENLNRFIDEGGRGVRAPRAGGSGAGSGREGNIEPERKDFWDSFGDPTTTPKTSSAGGGSGGSNAIGTAAMKGAAGGGAGGGTGTGGKNDEGGWAGGDDW